MKTNKKKIWIGCGILCVLSVLLSSWYAVAYNDSRLVVPMDFKDYYSFTCIGPGDEYLLFRYDHDDQAEEGGE